jgi:hypothetical protein
VVNAGKEMLLSFKDHGNKPSGAPVNMPGIQHLGQPGVQQLGIPSPNPPPMPGNAMGNPRGSISTIANTRPMTPTFNSQPATPLAAPVPVNESVRSIPRTMRTPSNAMNPQPVVAPINNPAPSISAEEQAAHFEIQNQLNQNNPDFPPLPPP